MHITKACRSLAFTLMIALSIALKASGGLPFSQGDVFVGGNEYINVFNQCGELVEVIHTGVNATLTGMAFDSSGNLYVTAFEANLVVKVSSADSSVTTFCNDDANSYNESIVFDSSGNAYVGQSNAAGTGNANIIKRNSAGSFLQRYAVAVESKGSDWLALSSDQKTMLYTSEYKNILRYDVSTQTQLSHFNAATLPCANAYAVAILPNGSVLVAADVGIIQLNSAGTYVKTIGSADAFGDGFYALALDPDGTSFWASEPGTGNVYRYDIATGTQLLNFGALTAPNGIAVYNSPQIKNSTVKVWWDSTLGIQTAPCGTVVLKNGNTYYIGGVFGAAVGLNYSDHSASQSAVDRKSVV